MKNHKLKFLRNSMVFYKGKLLDIDVFQCEKCEKYMIIDTKSSKQITLDGMIGEEILIKE